MPFTGRSMARAIKAGFVCFPNEKLLVSRSGYFCHLNRGCIKFTLVVKFIFFCCCSFHKGCYIGQELTARTHHTGVIRKRVMPIRFTQKRESPVEGGESIVNEAGKALGKFIAGDKTHGKLCTKQELTLLDSSFLSRQRVIIS